MFLPPFFSYAQLAKLTIISNSISPDDVDDTIGSEEAIAASQPKQGMTIDEQLLKAEGLKKEGNVAYESGDLTEALKNWHQVSRGDSNRSLR